MNRPLGQPQGGRSDGDSQGYKGQTSSSPLSAATHLALPPPPPPPPPAGLPASSCTIPTASADRCARCASHANVTVTLAAPLVPHVHDCDRKEKTRPVQSRSVQPSIVWGREVSISRNKRKDLIRFFLQEPPRLPAGGAGTADGGTDEGQL
ncbi:hypothetical protein E2C01_079522 [Portunus trituberculatus]|uniref:Uncharacterized protein n=1 Tax=Portunus trituberculatus TaxID=210409 RepID=A0A5B7IQU3_PORTR|nr:hypothetical protein [Portunus trituberculatus]